MNNNFSCPVKEEELCGLIAELQAIFCAQPPIEVKVRVLNELSQIHLNNNRYLSYLCMCESLRLHPDQQGVAEGIANMNLLSLHPRINVSQENEHLVSIIVPTCNRPLELKESLKSVLAQTIQDLEIIVINDGGNNDARLVVDSLKSDKIKYYYVEKKGVSAARNKGLSMAKGNYIAYLDDDDIFYANHLYNAIKAIEGNYSVDVVYSDAWRVHGQLNNGVFHACTKEAIKHRPDIVFDKDKLSDQNFISTLNLLHKRKCLELTGGFNEELKALEDWDFLLRLAINHKFLQLNSITGEYRLKGNNSSVQRMNEMQFNSQLLQPYYHYYRGKLANTKYHLSRKDFNNARKYLNEIEAEYHKHFKHHFALEDLVYCLNEIKNINFLRRVVKDYLDIAPRECIHSMLKYKSIAMAQTIFANLPARVLKAGIGRLKKHRSFY